MPILDVFAVILIGLFIFMGYKSGVLREIFGIVRLLVVFLITILLYGKLAVAFQAAVSSMASWVAQMIAFSVIFVPLSIMLWFIRIMIQGKMNKPPQTISTSMKLLGGIFGLLKGIFVVSLIFMFVDFYHTKDTDQSLFENSVAHSMIGNIAPSAKNIVFGIFSHPESNAQKDSDSDNPDFQ